MVAPAVEDPEIRVRIPHLHFVRPGHPHQRPFVLGLRRRSRQCRRARRASRDARSRSLALGYLAAALFMAGASFLRIWSGSVLTSRRMMSFAVKTDALLSSGPYRLVRNPIYLADLIAFTGFALCLPPIGLLLPVLLFLHYTQLIGYEERSLRQEFGRDYEDYRSRVPRLLPGFGALKSPRRRPQGDHGDAGRDPAQRPLPSFHPRLRPRGGHGQVRLGRGGRAARRRGLGDRSHEDRGGQGGRETGRQGKDVQGRPLRQLLGGSAARPGGLGDR